MSLFSLSSLSSESDLTDFEIVIPKLPTVKPSPGKRSSDARSTKQDGTRTESRRSRSRSRNRQRTTSQRGDDDRAFLVRYKSRSRSRERSGDGRDLIVRRKHRPSHLTSNLPSLSSETSITDSHSTLTSILSTPRRRRRRSSYTISDVTYTATSDRSSDFTAGVDDDYGVRPRGRYSNGYRAFYSITYSAFCLMNSRTIFRRTWAYRRPSRNPTRTLLGLSGCLPTDAPLWNSEIELS